MRLLISDTHHHQWTAFAKTLASGLNSRNSDILKATSAAVEELGQQGGKTIIHAGDLFHTRGSIQPSVFNPVVEYYALLVNAGFDVHMIPGNHDMEANDSNRVTNAITALEQAGVKVHTKSTFDSELNTLFLPWMSKVDDFREALKYYDQEISEYYGERQYDVVTHSPINGVIKGLPDHGLTPEEIFEIAPNMRNYLSGHYHNHKVFRHEADKRRKVVSIGALTHQNFGDCDSRAGFMLYDEVEGSFDQHETNAPKFISFDTSVDDPELVDFEGNYVRIKTTITKPSEIDELKQLATEFGAKAVVVLATKSPEEIERTGTRVETKHENIEESVSTYIKTKGYAKLEGAVIKESLSVLAEVVE